LSHWLTLSAKGTSGNGLSHFSRTNSDSAC